MCLFSSIFYKKDSKQAFIQNTSHAFLKHLLSIFKMLGPIQISQTLVNQLLTTTFKKSFNSLLTNEIIDTNLVPINHVNNEQIDFTGKIIANLLVLYLLDYPDDVMNLHFSDFEPISLDMQKPFVLYWLNDCSEQNLTLAQAPFQKLVIDTLNKIPFQNYFETLVWLPKTSSPFVIEDEDAYTV